MTKPDTGADRAQRLIDQVKRVLHAGGDLSVPRDWHHASWYDIEWLLQQGAVKDAEIAQLTNRLDAMVAAFNENEALTNSLIAQLDAKDDEIAELQAASKEMQRALGEFGKQLDAKDAEIARLSAHGLELAAKVSFVCSQDIGNTEQAARAALIHRAEKAEQALVEKDAEIARLRSVLQAIYTSTRGDEHGEQWTIRKWLDEHGIFNDDIQGSKRLVEAACACALGDRLLAETPHQQE